MNWAALFAYDAETGVLTWRIARPGRGCVAGRAVGSVGKHGYLTVMVDGRRHYVHRIAWEMVNGPIPGDRCLDHEDGDRLNNRSSNLRLVSLSENQRNRRLQVNVQLGIHGVRRKKNGFEVNCAGQYVGFYDDFFEACCARKSAERDLGFHPNHGRAR